MTVPHTDKLPYGLLAACFNRTSATYKFYWLLGILQELERGSNVIPKKALFARMVANAWFTINYYKVSFGRHDLLQDAILTLKDIEEFTVDQKPEDIYKQLLQSQHPKTQALLLHFNKQVPHWFLSPWFPNSGKESYAQRTKRIYAASKSWESKPVYSLYENHIEVYPLWKEYLTGNSSILKAFCYWHLTLFLQSKNPNVPDIANKLIKPSTRNNLTKQRTKFWDIALDRLGSVTCIYTGKTLRKGNYAVEHFIPYSFVSHDLIWNLIPADSSFNIIKSNKLPPLSRYFEPFYQLQNLGYQVIKSEFPKSKFLEEYLTILPTLTPSLNQDQLFEAINPLVTIASNNGFEFMPTHPQ